MAAIEALLQAVLGLLGTILGILGLIKVQTADVAQQSTLDLVQAGVTNANDVLADPTYGLAALQAMLVSIQGAGDHSIAEVLTAVGTPQQAGVAVTLPAAPPVSWVNGSAGSISAGVWDFVDPLYPPTITTLHELEAAANLAFNLELAEYQAVPSPNNMWRIFVQWTEYQSFIDLGGLPAIDVATIASTDASTLAWVQRAYPSIDWFDNGDGWVGAVLPGVSGIANPVLNVSPEDFMLVQDSLSKTHVPPVWPGLAGVTLGAPVALSQTFTVAGPMDGCIIAVTSAPPKQAFYTLGTQLNYRHLGAIAFVDDNGDAEVFQLVGWQHGVFLPLSMLHAASLLGRSEGGTVGTITPFTIN